MKKILFILLSIICLAIFVEAIVNVRCPLGNNEDGLVCMLHFDYDENPFRDDSSIQVSTATRVGVTSVTGYFSKGAEFNGSNQYITIDNLISYIGSANDWTIAHWFNSDVAVGAGYDCLLNAWISPAGGTASYLLLWNDSLYFKIKGGTEKAVNSAISISADTWYYVAYGRAGNDMFLQVDDNAYETTDITEFGAINTPTSVHFGSYNNSANYYNGTLDDFAFYDRGLTSEEISFNYYKQVGNYK